MRALRGSFEHRQLFASAETKLTGKVAGSYGIAPAPPPLRIAPETLSSISRSIQEESPAVFVATFDVIGVMHHIVIQRPKYSVIRHVGAPTDAHDDFSGWSPMCNHLSVFAPHLQFMSHYTGSLDPSDMRMSMVEILHVVLHNASSRSLNRGLQLLPACGQLNTLRLYIIQTLLSERE